jgi:ABC-type lipoprotein release transport system permease subunit
VTRLLYQTSTHDPVVFVAAAGTLLVTAVLASIMPLRRALQIDPVNALRDE